jgi:hypothetical protein
MKRIILFLFALTFAGIAIFAQNSKSQSGWNEYVGLYDPKVMDEFRDDNGEWWYLVVGESVTDRAFNQRNAGSGEEIGDSHNSLLIYNKHTHQTIVVPNYLIENNQFGGLGSECFESAYFSPAVNGFPRYIYYTLPTYATESAIYRYDIQNRTSKELCSGSVVAILPSGNLLICQTGFDHDKNGQIIPGRRGFDCIISPEGKTLWKSNSYDL